MEAIFLLQKNQIRHVLLRRAWAVSPDVGKKSLITTLACFAVFNSPLLTFLSSSCPAFNSDRVTARYWIFQTKQFVETLFLSLHWKNDINLSLKLRKLDRFVYAFQTFAAPIHLPASWRFNGSRRIVGCMHARREIANILHNIRHGGESCTWHCWN